jgi:peptidoglycan lytic transglycosylase G
LFKALLKFALIVMLVAASFLAYGLLVPATPSQQSVMLRPGSSARTIATDLRNAGVIRSRYAFLALHYFRVKPLKAGEYLFDRPANALEIYNRLAHGDIVIHTVVVPEGYNLWDVATSFEASGLATRAEFLDAARKNHAMINDLDPTAQSLEGYLFPDTYRFTRTQSLTDMLTVMTRRFRQEAKAIGLNSDFHKVVTMASIVEKETGAPEERPLVAGVYYNRLGNGMLLGADPTVVYAALLGNRYNGVIHQSDLDSDSPYNTYRVAGLPPGPIANPGRASLAAALHPQQTDYLYFVSDGNGHHRFARTGAEHDKNVALYRHATAGR